MKVKYIFMALAGLLMISCDLQEDASGFSTPEKFYKTRSQCVAALNYCYIPLKSLYTSTMLLATESVTDLSWSRSGTQDAYLDISPAKPRFGATVWEHGYRGIMYCNAAIAGIERSLLSAEDKTPLIIEGKILRAFYYWLLTSFFGDVPFYLDDVADEAIQAKIGKLPRMSAIETRNTLIKDLQKSLGTLDQIRSNEVPENRVGAAVGWMLIAKMAMWNKQWETALKALTNLESIYGDLSQYSLDDIPFRFKNTPESIFEIQHTYTAGGLIYTSNVANMCMPYPRSGSKYAGVEIPELGDNATTWAPMCPSGYLYSNLLPEKGTDKRRAMSLVTGWNGETFTDGNTYFGPKFWCFNIQSTYDSNNYKVFRYADVILMIAECHCMLQDDQDLAMEYLNKVKRRANITEYTHFRTWERLMDEIVAERGRELFGEFQRKFDLVRWGIWYDRVLLYSKSTKLLNNILPCHEYYPIPDTEVVYSGYALDNKAYDAYGL